jgi:hypothetical protein
MDIVSIERSLSSHWNTASGLERHVCRQGVIDGIERLEVTRPARGLLRLCVPTHLRQDLSELQAESGRYGPIPFPSTQT